MLDNIVYDSLYVVRVQSRLTTGEGYSVNVVDPIENLGDEGRIGVHVLRVAPQAVGAVHVAAAGHLKDEVANLHFHDKFSS